MPRFFRAHRIAALVVLIAAGAWILTGEFSAVGSEEANAAQEPAAQAAQPEAAPQIRTVAAIVPQGIDHARTIRLSGATEADKRVTLAARANGIVSDLTVAQGESVATDAVVLTLEGEDVTSGVTTAEATLKQRAQELQIAEKLFASGTLSDLQLTRARAEKAAAEAQLTQAQAAADRLTLRAPFGGIVDSVDVEEGEWVEAGTPIATILSLDPIVVRADVSEIDVGEVTIGAKAAVRLVNGTEMEGTIRDIAREASPQTRTFKIEVSLPNPGLAIPAGMTAEVQLFATPVKAYAVPRSVITLSDEGDIGLRVVGDDNIADFAVVAMIDDTEDGLIVTGVPEGHRIIVAGQDLVRDGEKVIVVEPPPAEVTE